MPRSSHTFLRRALPLTIAAALAGCERKAAREYVAPKDRPFVPTETAEREAPSPKREEVWRPALQWTLPAGWKDLGADPANVGRFSAGGASIAITALASMEGKESVLVNMWRQVRGLEPVEEAEAAKTLMDVPMAGGSGKMFEVNDGEKATSFVVAFTHRPEGSLFFKIQGAAAAVAEQKAAFFELLRSVKFSAGESPPPAPPPAETAALPGNVPAGWTAVAPGPMQQAKFSVPEKDGAKADVMVSVFPSATGGTVENVKRWRNQLKLAAIPDDEIAQLAQPLPGAPEGSILVDLKNEARALTGAIVVRDGQWWFVKLLGDAPAVAAAREAFVKFAASIPGK